LTLAMLDSVAKSHGTEPKATVWRSRNDADQSGCDGRAVIETKQRNGVQTMSITRSLEAGARLLEVVSRRLSDAGIKTWGRRCSEKSQVEDYQTLGMIASVVRM
jgi:hypothetical protein